MQDGRRLDWLDRLGDLVASRSVKLTLAFLIIVSVLPFPELEDRLRPLFLVAFGSELAIRAALFFAGRTRRTAAESLFLIIDLAALVSFLPLERWTHVTGVNALTLLRLARLLVLLRFGRELAHDIYLIITRREQLQQFALVTFAVFILSFVSAVLLHQLDVPNRFDGSGDAALTFWDRMWWSFRNIESADNLVPSVRVSPLLAAISLVLTVTGVFIVSFIIGIGANVVDQVVKAERRRAVGYRGHSLVIGPVQDSEILVGEFVRIYEKHRPLSRFRPQEFLSWLFRKGPPPRRHALPRMALLGPGDEAPPYLYDAMMRWVVYRQGDGADPEALARVNASHAKRVILLARPETGGDCDAITVASLTALRAINPTAQAFVEVLESANRDIVHAVGGPNSFPLDVPRFLGLFLCQHLIVPGVELLYRDLLTAGGSEFYTHIFVDEEEYRALEGLGQHTWIPFAEMARSAYLEFGVILTGVFLGESQLRRLQGDLVPINGLVRWLNPYVVPDDTPAIEALGGRPGQIPVRTLRGLVGVCSTYVPLKRYVRALVLGRGRLPGAVARAESTRRHRWWARARGSEAVREPPGASPGESVGEPGPATDPGSSRLEDQLASRVLLDDGELRRVLIVGYSTALPSLLRELSRFVAKLELILVLGGRGDESRPLRRRLESLGIGFTQDDPLPGESGQRVMLERGGYATVYTLEGRDLASFAVSCLAEVGAVDAAVFLSEPEAGDRDARTALRLLRFARALETGRMKRGVRLHLIAEFLSLSRGERLRDHLNGQKCGFPTESQLRLTLVSTEQIKNYFMVHSAFVPGVTALYDELLSERGQEIVRLEMPALRMPAGNDPFVFFHELIELLRPLRCIPIAVEQIDGRVLLNPGTSDRFVVAHIAGLYVIGDTAWLGRTIRRLE